ncbi:MAG: hypothetical protein ACFFAO_19610 [Candidatus Hermodarchaeota archaeon]
MSKEIIDLIRDRSFFPENEGKLEKILYYFLFFYRKGKRNRDKTSISSII